MGILDLKGGSGETMALPKGANEGVVNGSGWMSTTVDMDRSGKSGMVKMRRKGRAREEGEQML